MPPKPEGCACFCSCARTEEGRARPTHGQTLLLALPPRVGRFRGTVGGVRRLDKTIMSCGHVDTSEPCGEGAPEQYSWVPLAGPNSSGYRLKYQCVGRAPRSGSDFLCCLRDYTSSSGEQGGARVLLYGDSILRGAFEDWGWTIHESTWAASRAGIAQMGHIAPDMLRRTLVDEHSGVNHTFDYLQRTAFGPELVATHRTSHRYVYLYGNQRSVLEHSADHAERFFQTCARNAHFDTNKVNSDTARGCVGA